MGHELHATGRCFPETSCYTDVLIELLAARGLDPAAMLAFTVAVDFEGDQWTFLRPPQEDLRRLYGLDIHEMQLYRPLAEHAVAQLRNGGTLIVDCDAWHLPDLAGTSYRTEHVKTSIALDAIDPPARRLRYFHNTGCWELDAEDYDAVMQPGPLTPYTEVVRVGPRPERPLRETARELLRVHLDRVPADDPLERFGRQLTEDLPDLEDFHAYAFATTRQVGAACELAASFARWLEPGRGEEIAEELEEVARGAKVLSFRLARKRLFDPTPILNDMSTARVQALTELRRLAG